MQRRFSSLLFWMMIGAAALVACDTTIPPAPPVTVVITAVDNTTALAQAVQEAMNATDQANIDLTATVLAQGGVTLTPSNTPTETLSPTPTVTRFVTATSTPTATPSPTATFAPYLTNTPGAVGDASNGWIRIVNAWRDITGTIPTTVFDAYINDERVSRAMAFGGQSTYYRVPTGAVRITLRTVDALLTDQVVQSPLISSVVSVSPGSVSTIVAVDRGSGLEFVDVPEDSTPLPTGLSRLTILQANASLLTANFLLPSLGRALVYNLAPGSLVGPFDLPPGSYPVSLYDSEHPDQLITTLTNTINLANRVNYLVVFVPPASATTSFSDVLLFSGITRRLATDTSVRFVNVASKPFSVYLDSQLQIPSLAVGAVSDIIPVSQLGTVVKLRDPQQTFSAQQTIGPWITPEDQASGKIILFMDSTDSGADQPITMIVLSENVQQSLINANIRLIHGLPNTRPLTLQIRLADTSGAPNTTDTTAGSQAVQTQSAWISIGDASQAGAASNYASRVPGIYDVRVVLSGSADVIGSVSSVQMLPGGVYDFVALPGSDVGSFNLVMLEPETQLGSGGTTADSATAVYEAVNATLTAQAPQTTVTATRAATSTPTRTPIATNTPRPTNTAAAVLPTVQVAPAPPLRASGTILVNGDNFRPAKTFTVLLDNNAASLARGTTGLDGTLGETTVNLPKNITPGSHTLTICVDCGSRLSAQVVYAVFLVADPKMTATPTATP
jgi:Domain of unknown function (DUF4397)